MTAWTTPAEPTTDWDDVPAAGAAPRHNSPGRIHEMPAELTLPPASYSDLRTAWTLS